MMTLLPEIKEVSMREEEIRPEHLKIDQREHLAADIRRLLQHKHEFVNVSCPACGVDNSHVAFEKYGLTYVVCGKCDTLYVNPRPTPVILDEFYATSENYKYWNKYIFPASEEARRAKIFRPRAERLADICRRYKVETNTLLEVGAGFGTFCEEIQRIGLFKRVIAVEPTPDLAETCRRKGLEVIDKPIEQVHWEQGAVNVVASFEVIEHLFSPADYIRSCFAVLNVGGLLVLSCPNIKGFDVSVLMKLSDTIDFEHLNYFHPTSLSNLVLANGFDVVEILTPGNLDAELVRKKILSGEFDVSSQPFLHRVLVERWDDLGGPFQKFLVDQNMSSHMWLVARKREVID